MRPLLFGAEEPGFETAAVAALCEADGCSTAALTESEDGLEANGGVGAFVTDAAAV